MTTYLLDTSNKHCYVYTTEELHIEVLGGIKLDSHLNINLPRFSLNRQKAFGYLR